MGNIRLGISIVTVQCYRGDLVLALELQLAVVVKPQHDDSNNFAVVDIGLVLEGNHGEGILACV